MRVVIADDERLARDRVARLAQAIPGIEIVAVCSSGEAVLQVLRGEAVDLLLLDIAMPGLSGMDLAGLLSEGGPAVIFVTAHPEHALEAFGVGAAHYLLKPVDAASLAEALGRVRPLEPSGDRPIPIPGTRGLQLIHPRELSHALVEGASVALYLPGQIRYTTLSLSELERRLPAEHFVRVHRRALLGLHALAELRTIDGRAVAILRTGEEVEVSRRGAQALRRLLPG